MPTLNLLEDDATRVLKRLDPDNPPEWLKMDYLYGDDEGDVEGIPLQPEGSGFNLNLVLFLTGGVNLMIVGLLIGLWLH